jgi:hypothetical protein
MLAIPQYIEKNENEKVEYHNKPGKFKIVSAKKK